MNIVEFQEKMNPTHRASLCQMLRTEKLPECLLGEYIKAKVMVDRVDGNLTVGELAILALAAGFHPDTGKFEQTLKETTEGEDARLQKLADDFAAKPATEVPTMTGKQAEAAIASGAAMPVESPALEESGDKVIEEAVQIGSDATGANEPNPVEPVSGATGQAAEKPREGKAMLWSPDMPVNVLQEDELKKGKVFAVHPADGDTPIQLTLSLDDGTTITVNEDEVEAV